MLTESGLLLGVQDAADAWDSYPSTVNEIANTVTSTFATPLNFKGITASSDIPLGIENLHNDLIEISIYPNPVASKLFIRSDEVLEKELFNILGKSILKTSANEIDLSNFQSALYILKVTDQATSKSNTYKIIKK